MVANLHLPTLMHELIPHYLETGEMLCSEVIVTEKPAELESRLVTFHIHSHLTGWYEITVLDGHPYGEFFELKETGFNGQGIDHPFLDNYTDFASWAITAIELEERCLDEYLATSHYLEL